MSNDLALPILTNLFNAGGSGTVKDARTNSVYMIRLREAGLIRQVGTVQTGQRGRPALLYRLTDKARKRVKRAIG